MTQRSFLILPALRTLAFGTAFIAMGCGQGPRTRQLALPPRAVDALGASELAPLITDLDVESREERLFREISNGNVPSWLRRMARVRFPGKVDGREHRVTLWVTPDYLSVGSDADFLPVPLTGRTAQRVADLVGAGLPTPRMVDEIWGSARVRFAPVRIGPGEEMATVPFFTRHADLIRSQRFVYGHSLGALSAGHKLDVVLTPELARNPGAVALYGWHQPNGEPIQTLFLGRKDDRPLFSQGVRLVHRTMMIDGEEHDLLEVLQDPEWAGLLSDEGVIRSPCYPAESDPIGG